MFAKDFALKFGDQLACLPATNKDIITITTKEVPAIAHGRLIGLRSPLLEIKGSANNKKKTSNGPKNMTYDSISAGIKANKAYIHSKNQSGCGVVIMLDGSGGFVKAGGPNTTANTTIAMMVAEPNNASRQAA